MQERIMMRREIFFLCGAVNQSHRWMAFLDSTLLVRLSAHDGMLLLFWMTMSMLGGLILLPAILAQFKPKFVFNHAPAAAPAPVPSVASSKQLSSSDHIA